MPRRFLLPRIAVFLFALIEVPVWLVRHRGLFSNQVIYVFQHRSFGHTVSGLDFAARLFHPNRVSLVYFPHPDTNEYLLRCFEQSMDVFVFESRAGRKAPEVDAPRLWVTYTLLRLLGRAVVRLEDVYAWNPLAPGPLYGSAEDGATRIAVTNYTGYLRLVQADVGKSPRLPDELLARCRDAIISVAPTFVEQPFATVLLRRKGEGGDWTSRTRVAGDQRNYRRAVELLTRRGYNVVGTGETDPDTFRDLEGFFDLSTAGLPPGLLNVFLLTECALFIGQQSGPFGLPDACGIPCVLCDAFPYRQGTFRARDLVLFKPLIESTGRRLTLTEVYLVHEDLAFGYGLDEAGVSLGENDADEIGDAVAEMLATIDGTLKMTAADERLANEFRALVPETMPLHWHGNRPPLAALRAHLR